MLHFNSVIETNVLLFTYMFLYNMSLVALIWTILNVISTQMKTLYNFSGFSFNPYYLLLLSVLLMSMAGVPPFIGFFSKLFIITLLTNSGFFSLYPFFFVILFLGLYFYIQNIRFLHSTNTSTLNHAYLVNERQVVFFYYFSMTTLIVIIGGVFYIDDFLLFFSWLFY